MRQVRELYKEAAALLPPDYRKMFLASQPETAEEIRLRIGWPLTVVTAGENITYDTTPIYNNTLDYVLEKATDSSMHAVIASLKNGFVSRNGLRIGICGEAVIKQGQITGYRHYSSLNIRIPRECAGISSRTAEDIFSGGLRSILIISPPGMGKTSLLRDIVRWLSYKGVRVGVIDERNEISGSSGGETGFNLGPNTDVMLMASKEEGTMVLLRGMNPQVIAMDEISSPEDARKITEICSCGVHIIATAHAADLGDMKRRNCYAEILGAKIFDFIVIIGIENGKRVYNTVCLR